MGELEDIQTLRKQLEDKINELSQANSQLTKLRRTTLKQLSSIDNITKPLFALDREYFGGKYQEREDGSNPFQDMQIAVDIVDAAREQLSGDTVMADTPQLREQLGSLSEAIESLRDAALIMRRQGLEAVGLPVDSSGFAARSFPEEDPVAFIVDVSGFAREMQGICERTNGRIQALTSMVQDADQVRGQAEEQLEEFKTNPQVLAETARREAETLQSELNELRIVLAQMQEKRSSESFVNPEVQNQQNQQNQALLQGLQLELERGNADRMADLAEVRSLAGDICMLAGEMARGTETEELAAARNELKNILAQSDADIGSLAANAESVFLRLAEGLQEKIDSSKNELSQLREQNDAATASADSANVADAEANGALIEEANARATALQEELNAVRAERETTQEQLREAAQERDALQQRIDASGQSASALEQQLGEMNGELQTAQNRAVDAEHKAERLEKDLSAAEAARDAAKESLSAMVAKHNEAADAARELRLELAEAESRIQSLEEELAAQQQVARKASVAADDAQSDVAKAQRATEEARGDAQRNLEQLEKRVSQAESERDKVRVEMQDSRRASEDSLRRVSDIANEKDDAERSARAQQMHAVELEKQVQALKDKLAEQETLVQDQQAESLKIAKERDESKHAIERLEKELADANDRAAASTADAERVQTGSSQELDKLKEQLEAQAEGRRNREATFHGDKLALEKTLDDMKKAHDILQEQFDANEREYKSLQRQVNLEKQNRQVTDSDATSRVREALAEVEKYRSEREQQDLIVSQADELKKESERRIAANEDEMNKMRSARDAMQRQMAESHRQTQALEEKMKQLQAANKDGKAADEQLRITAEKERQDLAVQKSDLEKQLAAELDASKQIREEHASQSDLMGKMKVEYDDTITKMRHREDEVESLGRRLERVQKDMSAISGARDELADKLATTTSRDDQQKRTIANLERQMRTAEEQHAHQVEELRGYLTAAREQIVGAKRDLEEHDQTDREIIRELLESVKRHETGAGTQSE